MIEKSPHMIKMKMDVWLNSIKNSYQKEHEEPLIEIWDEVELIFSVLCCLLGPNL